MQKPSIKNFFVLLVGSLLLTSCAQPGPATPPPPTAAPLPTAIPDAVAVELGSIGKGTPAVGAWSPDGSRLAIASTQGIIIYTLPDWNAENFISLPSRVIDDIDLQFLSDGNGLLFRADQSDKIIYEINLLNNEINELPIRSQSKTRSRLIVSPDGKTIASYRTLRSYSNDEEKTINLEILDKSSGKVIHSFTSQVDTASMINSAVFSPDSKWIAAGGEDNHVRLYDVNTGDIRLDISHDSDVKSVAFSPDGKMLVSTGDDATVQFRDVETGKMIRTMKDFTETISFAGYCSRGEEFLVRFWNGTYQKWALDENRLPASRLDFNFSVPGSRFSTISSNGESLLTIQDKEVKVWELKTGREITTFPEYTGSFSDLNFSADGKYLAAIDLSSDVVLWDTDTGKYSTRLDLKDSHALVISFHPRVDLLAVGQPKGLIETWDMTTREVIARYQSEDECSFESMKYSPDGLLLAASSYRCGILVWDTSSGKLRVHLDTKGMDISRTSIWFDRERDEIFATSLYGRSVSRWDLNSGKLIGDVKLTENNTMPFIDPVRNRVYERVSTESSNMLTAWDAVTGEKIMETGQPSCCYTQAVDPTGTLLATYTNSSITFYDLGSLQALTSNDFIDNLLNMVFSPDQRYLAVQSSMNGPIHIFNIESVYERASLIKNVTPPTPAPSPSATPTTMPTDFPESIAQLTPVDLPVSLPGAITKDRVKNITELGSYGFGEINTAVWSPDSRYLALIGRENILLYRQGSSQPDQILPQNGTPISITFSPDHQYLAVNTSEDLTLWEVQTGQILHVWTEYRSDGLLSQISFSPDNRSLQVRKTEYSNNHISRSDIILDLKTGAYVETREIPDKKEDLSGLSLSPDGSFAVTVTNQSVHIIDPSTRVIRYTFERPVNDIGSIRNWGISSLGKLMLRYSKSSSADKETTVELWDVSIDSPPSLLWTDEAGPIYNEEGRPFGNPNFDFSPDGRLLAVSDNKSNVRVWDTSNGKLLNQMDKGNLVKFSPDNSSLLLIDSRGFSSVWNINVDLTITQNAEMEGFGTSGMYMSEYFTGDSLVTIANQKISTWDISNAKKMNVPTKTRFLENAKPGLLALSSINTLATTQDTGKISIYDTETGSLIKKLMRQDDQNEQYNLIAISHDGKTVVSPSYKTSDGKSSIYFWDVSSGEIRKELPFPSFNVARVVFSADDQLILGVSRSGSKNKGTELIILDSDSGEPLRYFSHLGDVISLHPDGNTLVSIMDDGTFSFLDLNTGNVLWQGKTGENVRDLAFSPDGKLLAVLTLKTLEFWDTSTHEKLSEFPTKAGKISFSPDGKYISLSLENGIHQVLGLKN